MNNDKPVHNDPAFNASHTPAAGADFAASGSLDGTDEMLAGAIEKMTVLLTRMTEITQAGAAPADYEIATKIGDAARSALDTLHKYANNIDKV